MPAQAKANRSNLLVTLFVALGSFTYGYNSSSSANVIGLPAFFDYFNIDITTSSGSTLLGAVNGLFTGGGAIGCWIVAWVADRLGRRKCIQIICLICIISAAIQAGSVHIGMFLVGRFLNGIGIGMINCIVPTYQSEIAPPAQRGRLVGWHGVLITLGYGGGSFTALGCYFEHNPTVQLRLPMSLQSVAPLILLLGSFWLPESPRWLLSRGRDEEGLHVLEAFHTTAQDSQATGAHIEFIQIKRQLQLEADAKITNFWQIMSKPSLRKRMICGFGVQWLLQSTGVLVLFNYQILLYQNLGLSGYKPLLLNGVYNLISSLLNRVNGVVIDRFGRIRIMVAGLIGCVIVVSCYVAMVAEYAGTTNKVGNAMGVLFLFLFLPPYSGCLDAASYVYCSEIFPTGIRAHGVGFSVSGLFLANLVYQQAAPTAFNNIGWKYFLVFIIIPAVGIYPFMKYCPETKGLSLEEIAGMFGDEIALEVTNRTDDELLDMEKGAWDSSKHNEGVGEVETVEDTSLNSTERKE